MIKGNSDPELVSSMLEVSGLWEKIEEGENCFDGFLNRVCDRYGYPSFSGLVHFSIHIVDWHIYEVTCESGCVWLATDADVFNVTVVDQPVLVTYFF